MAIRNQSVESSLHGNEWLAVLKQIHFGEWAGIFGKLVGVGLFATLVYSYCNVLIEACIRGVR